MLREQLEQATSANQQLTLDIQKLTNDWNKAREELEARDEEEQAYFANEHVRLMDMWKTVNNFRRQFNEMKSATQRYFFLTGVGWFVSGSLETLLYLLAVVFIVSFVGTGGVAWLRTEQLQRRV